MKRNLFSIVVSFLFLLSINKVLLNYKFKSSFIKSKEANKLLPRRNNEGSIFKLKELKIFSKL